ncbi:MAG: HlyD family efflux transporter periplasmic adaptor subunit, partial [Pseudonocardia sp.]
PPAAAKRWITAGTLVVLAASGMVACGMEMAPPPTARVERDTVSVSVSASGALSAVQAQNIGFSQGGQIVELPVKVGDVVAQGQLLARLDPFAAQQALNQAQAQLAQQQAELNKILNGNSIGQAERDLAAAQDVLDATEANADAANEQAEKAVSSAQKQVDDAERALDQARRSCTTTQSANSQFTPSTTSPAPTPTRTYTFQRQCSESDAAVSQAKTALVNAKTNLANAKKQEDVTQTQGEISVANAQRSVVQAENNLDTARRNNPADIAAQQAAVRNAAVQVTIAQQDLDNRTLLAPIGGTITSINGAVGEFLNSGTSTTPLAPGSGAAIPGVQSGVGASDASGAVNVSAPGGSNFIVLGDVNSFQVVVPFEESDAAQVRSGQKVEVSFDAIPDLELPGTVLAVAPSGTAISGVTNYYVTVQLTETDDRLRDRQTAEANVLTQSVENVLSVPNAAVVRQGGQTFVNVPGPDDNPMQVPFEAGLQGDDRTEVKSGLTEGQEVLLPQATVTASPENQGGPR